MTMPAAKIEKLKTSKYKKTIFSKRLPTILWSSVHICLSTDLLKQYLK